MPSITVCSLLRLGETVRRTGARRLLTVINAATPVERPAEIAADGHLFLGFNDITAPVEGMTPPGADHVAQVLDFARDWDRAHPFVIHCFAGISRSTASAYMSALALNPDLDEMALALELRRRAPSATPNIRMIAFADEQLGRSGRMVKAIERIGRGADAFEGTPFEMPLAL